MYDVHAVIMLIAGIAGAMCRAVFGADNGYAVCAEKEN